MKRSRLLTTLLILGLALLVLLTFVACKKKAPPVSVIPSGPENPPPTSGWKTEVPPPALNVESDADMYNRQGVLKRVQFETNKWDILPESRVILKANAAWVLAHPQFRLVVEGHCDERNTEAYNLALGERRANAAKEYLVGLGVPGDKIQTVSYGKSRPICFDHDDSCWAQNRRDEFILQDLK
jgi:peptidoglycan-associated lipoprotein